VKGVRAAPSEHANRHVPINNRESLLLLRVHHHARLRWAHQRESRGATTARKAHFCAAPSRKCQVHSKRRQRVLREMKVVVSTHLIVLTCSTANANVLERNRHWADDGRHRVVATCQRSRCWLHSKRRKPLQVFDVCLRVCVFVCLHVQCLCVDV
jgi:hypothetical protein